MDVAANSIDTSTSLEQHEKSLFIQYGIIYQYPPGIFNENTIHVSRKLATLNVHILEALCSAIIPPGSVIRPPLGRAALLFSLVTGQIIHPESDAYTHPFFATELQQTYISPQNARYMNFLYLLAQKNIRDWTQLRYEMSEIGEFVTEDCYISLDEPSAHTWKKLCLDYVATIDKPNGPNLRKQLLFLAGMDMSLYKTDDIENDVASPDYIFSGDMGALVTHLVTERMRTLGYPLSIPILCLDMRAIRFYSDLDIVKKYMPRLGQEGSQVFRYTERYEFMEELINTYKSDSGWSLAISNCSNADSNHLVLQEKRGQTVVDYMNSNSEERNADPFLTYGPSVFTYATKCYQASELEASFDEQITGFEFRDPDWSPVEQKIDPWTGTYVSKFMSVNMLRDLMGMLREPSMRRYPILQSLLQKMEEGFNTDDRLSSIINKVHQVIHDNDGMRIALIDYMSWLFLFAMWIRFWKGPGNPYPVNWQEQDPNTCVYNQRDENISIELLVHGKLLQNLERRGPGFIEFVSALPYVYHSWTTGESKVPNIAVANELLGAYTIEGIIDLVSRSQFCMAQATDILSGTAYVYLTMMLGVNKEQLNDYLTDILYVIYDMEMEAAEERRKYLESVTLPTTVIDEYMNVMSNVMDEDFVQPGINTDEIIVTRHLPFDIEAMEIGDFDALHL